MFWKKSAFALLGLAVLLTAASVRAQDCAPLPDGIVSWWPAEGDARDIISGNNGVVLGGTAFEDGIVGQAFSFNGADSYVQVPHDDSLNPTGPFSVDVWTNADAQQTDSQVLILDKSHGWTDGTGWALQTNTDGTACFFYGTGGGNGDPSHFHGVCTITSVLDNQWHHIAGVYTGSEFRIYLDGVLENSLAFTDPIANNNRDVEIGRSWGGGSPRRYFRGLIDEVDFFNSALTDDQVQAIYDADGTGKCLPQ